jgi:xanthine dehydrogenase YagR molybdenum-binding subunit
MSKKVKLKVGLESNPQQIAVEIPEQDPRPWDLTDKLKFVGSRVPRIDGHLKTSGRAKYSYDMQLPGMLHAKILRSPYPAAIVKSIDTSIAEKYPGVQGMAIVQDTLPLVLRFAGQEILAVAADTQQQAQQALKLIKIEYDIKPFVVDLEKARRTDAPLVHEKEGDTLLTSNVRSPDIYPKDANPDEVDRIIDSSTIKVEATYRTQVQTHSSMETHGLVAQWDDEDKITVWISTQSTFTCRDDIADYFHIPKANVRVITEFMGGGFGSKLWAWPETFLALKLARDTHRPVRLLLERKEEQLCAGNRPSSVQALKIGARRDGKITGIKLISYGSAGVGTDASTSGPAKYIYDCDKIYTSDSDVYINAGPGAPMRAPGHPTGVFALEQSIDDLAYQLKMDPLEFRKMNTLSDEVRQMEYAIGAEKIGWSRRNPLPRADRGPIKHGIGMANSLWYYITGRGFDVALQIYNDGSVHLKNGVQDIGGGTFTVLATVAAEELTLKPSDIQVSIGDTNFGLGPSSGGSQTVAGISPVVRNAAYAAKMRLFKIAAEALEVEPDELEIANGVVSVKSNVQKKLSWKELTSKIAGGQFTVYSERGADYFEPKRWKIAGVQFAEVEVDTETGLVQVKRVVAVHDCGKPMDRLTVENQIQGGIIQGISYALFENRILDRNTGLMVNPNLEQYKIAGSLDVPQIETYLVEYPMGQSSTSAVGIGEPATIPTVGAIANAVYHALGVRIRELPMTPAIILAALESATGRG